MPRVSPEADHDSALGAQDAGPDGGAGDGAGDGAGTRERPSLSAAQNILGRAAWVGSEVFSPPVLIALMLVSLAVVTDPNWVVTTVISVIAFAVIPQAVAIAMTLRGRATDKFIVNRAQRHLFYAIVMASTLLGAAATLLVTESAWVSWACFIAVGLVAVVAVINTVFKISLHALISALTAVVIASAFSWWVLLATIPVWALVIWSRVHLGRHSRSEVIAGSTLGFLAAGVLLLGAGVPMG